MCHLTLFHFSTVSGSVSSPVIVIWFSNEVEDCFSIGFSTSGIVGNPFIGTESAFADFVKTIAMDNLYKRNHYAISHVVSPFLLFTIYIGKKKKNPTKKLTQIEGELLSIENVVSQNIP